MSQNCEENPTSQEKKMDSDITDKLEKNELVSTEVDNDDENATIIDPECEDLDLNHHRIVKIQNFEPLTKLKKLCLRWNLIKKIENLSTLTTLTELELYDNQITEIENLEALTNLQ